MFLPLPRFAKEKLPHSARIPKQKLDFVLGSDKYELNVLHWGLLLFFLFPD